MKSACLKLISKFDDRDSDLVFSAIDDYQTIGLPPEKAQVAAVRDALRVLQAERDSHELTASNVRLSPDRNLILAHNLTAENFRAAMDLGGLPAPSLAITKVDAPIQGFGEITLIGDTSLATPSAKNPVYDADVYSPRFPDVKVKVDDKLVRSAIKPLADAAQAAGMRPRTADSAIDEMSRNRLSNAIGDLSYDPALRLGYANAILGKNLTVPTKQVEEAPSSKAGVSIVEQSPLRELLPTLDLSVIKPSTSGDLGKKVYAALINKTLADLGDEAKTPEGFTKAMGLVNRRINIFANTTIESGSTEFEIDKVGLMSGRGLDAIINLYRNMQQDRSDAPAAPTVRTETDFRALDDSLNHEAPREQFSEWLREKLRPAMGERRIVKESGRTTEFTLDNIVREMTRKVRDAEGFNYGLGNARSKGATKFKSLKQIQGVRDRIVSKEEFEAARKEIDAEFGSLVNAVAPFQKYKGDSATELLAEAIGNSYSTPMSKALEDAALVGVPESLQARISEFAGALVDAPTEYFEAKPQRAVGLDEFKGAVVPSDTPSDVIDMIGSLGLQIEQYSRGDQASRSSAVKRLANELNNSGSDVLFSRGRPGGSLGIPQIEAMAERVMKDWANPPSVIVATDMSDPVIPEAAAKEDAQQLSNGAKGTPSAFYHKGTVYIIASQMRSNADVVDAMFHEALGHYGMRRLFGLKFTEILNDISNVRRQEVINMARKYGLTSAKVETASDQEIWAQMSPEQRLKASEEVLAFMAQETPELSFVKRAIAVIRTWLRNHIPMLANMYVTDDQIINGVIIPARKFVKQGLEAAKYARDTDIHFQRSSAKDVSAPYTSDTITIDGVERSALNSEGRRIAETEEQLRNFWLWFGDSLVVDAKGNPLVVYHGTKSDVQAFDIKRAGASDPGLLGKAFYFTPSGAQASSFAERSMYGSGGAPNVMPVYLSVRNPVVFRDGVLPDGRGLSDIHPQGLTKASASAIQKELKKAGHDGAIFYMDGEPVQYVAFRPEQIKSAIGNNGQFDPANPDIRKSRKREQDQTDTPEFKSWFKDSKVVDADGSPLVVYHGTNYVDQTGNAITQFKPGPGSLGVGMYVTKSYNAAAMYPKMQNIKAKREGREEGPISIMPVYVSAKNPYVIFDIPVNGIDTKKLKEMGHDSVMYKDEILLFSPEQIKSAIGNQGTFDPANPDIRKSANRPWFEDASKLKVTSTYQLGDLLDTSKKLTWWDKSVGTMYHVAQRHPEFKRAYDAIQGFIGDISTYANRSADMAPTILPKLEDWKDIAAKPLSAEDVRALRDPIFGGTLNYSRDENGEIQYEQDVQKAGVVFTDQELRSIFGLNDRQIGLYHEVRNAIDQSITDLAISDMIRYLGKDGIGVERDAMESGDVDMAASIIQSHLEEMADTNPDRADVLGGTMKAIQEKADKAKSLIAKGYAPLSRFGQYTVYAVDQNGEQLYFSMFENERDANVMAREMREQYPQATVKTGVMSQESYKLFSGITPETLELFGESLGLEQSGLDAKDEAFQQYLKLAKTNRSAMKRLIHRKGIDGFSEDAGRVLAGFVVSNARQVSTNLHASEIAQSVSSIKDGDVKDAAIRMMEHVQNPREEAQALRGLMFANFIGGSIASAAVNMTQPFTMTLPYLSQFDGAMGAGRRMVDAVKLASRGITDDDDLKTALKQAEDDGVVSPQEIFQLMGQAQGKSVLMSGDGTKIGDARAKVNNAITKLGLGWGKVFSAAEQFNRRVTFLAAYKLARDKGMADPFAFAEKAVHETQGVFNKGNKPEWARGAVGATLFTFKQYSIAYIEFLQRMWGNGPEGKKAVGLALLVLFMVSGLGGLPGADDLDDVIDGIMQRVFGKSFNSKQKKKEFLVSLLGDSGADFVMSGISGLPGAPIDVSGRMGLGNLIPGTGVLTKKQSYQRDVTEIFGPAGTMVSNWASAAGSLAQGDVAKAATSVSPLAVQNVLKAIDMATMGEYRDGAGRKIINTNGWEAAVKAIGFQPSSVKRIQDATSIQQNLIAQNRIRESEIVDMMVRGRVERKPDLLDDARRQLVEWNAENPDSPIKINQNQINRRVQQANMDKAKRLAAAAPRELRQSVAKELELVRQ